MSSNSPGTAAETAPAAPPITPKKQGYRKGTRATEIRLRLSSQLDGCEVVFVCRRPTIAEMAEYDRERAPVRGQKSQDEIFRDTLGFMAEVVTSVEGFEDFPEVAESPQRAADFKRAFLAYFEDESDWIFSAKGYLDQAVYPQRVP